MLSDSESEASGLHTLTINEHFAKAFEYKKEREELAKLKEKYGSDYSESGPSDNDSDDSEDTEEDSDGEELTLAVDAAILRTLARIRKKDPVIYESGRHVFEEEHTQTQNKAPVTRLKAKDKSRPLTIREAALASVLANTHSRSPSPRPLTHTEEQVFLRSETRAAFHGAVDSEGQGDDGDELLIPRARTQDEIEQEEEEYKAFLEREVGEDLHNLVNMVTDGMDHASENIELLGDGKKKFESKKKKREGERVNVKEKGDEAQRKQSAKKRGKRSKEEADREFLMEYIFNRGWIDRSSRRVPTYDEIVEASSRQSKQQSTKSQADSNVNQNSHDDEGEVKGATMSDEDSFDDFVDAFETSYNFRFEEPGGGLISSFPRNLSSARRESTTRKDARSRKRERQVAEKQALLDSRREEIRKERALAEATIAGELRDNDVLLVGQDIPNKKSKKQQRKEEQARLKMLKAKELRRKLEMVSSEGGLDGIDDEALAHLDLDGDWDSSKHDAQMAELYGGDDIVDDGDTKKPVWDDDINIDDIEPPVKAMSKAELKKQKKKEKKKKTDKDVGVDVDEMDADLDAGAAWDDDGEEWKGTEEERKRKVDAYMEEVVNKLGFSGITSHMPTRFHYTSVAPENYGLAPSEILLATDAELNSYVGLKKLAPYRVDKGGEAKKSWDPKRVQRLKEFRENLHSRVGNQQEGSWSLDRGNDLKSRAVDAQGEKKKRKGKKERAKLKVMQGEVDKDGDDNNITGVQPEATDGSHKRKHDVALPDEPEETLEDDAPKRRRKRRHKKKSSEGEENAAAAS